MEKTKTLKMASYNVMAGREIIAKADCWYAGGTVPGYVIEIIPYEEKPEQAGIGMTDKELWDDFYDSEESGGIPPVPDKINELLSTMIADLQQLRGRIEVRRRKDVFDLQIEKQGEIFNLVMVCQYECGLNGNQADTGIFIHDPDDHDIWCFPLGTDDAEIGQKIYPSLIKGKQ